VIPAIEHPNDAIVRVTGGSDLRIHCTSTTA
jgi:hypothetical protein